MKSFAVAAIAVLSWLVLALAIDRLVLARYCAHCAALALELRVKLPAAELTYPPVSVLLLVVVPMVVFALYLIPWRRLGVRSAWQDSISRWCQPWFWLLVAILLTIIGESIYIVVRKHLPASLTDLAKEFSVTVTLSAFKGYKPLTLTASLCGLLGLVLGAYLFLARGVRELLKWPGS
jgi:hypothetical protein